MQILFHRKSSPLQLGKKKKNTDEKENSLVFGCKMPKQRKHYDICGTKNMLQQDASEENLHCQENINQFLIISWFVLFKEGSMCIN